MRLIFAGTPEFSCPSLSLLAREFDVSAVLTSPDVPQGRGRKLSPSPVATLAESLGIDTLKFERLGKQARLAIEPYSADLLIAVAYGKIFGPKFLSLFRHGGINVHPSLLPKFRGPAPIPAAILAGEGETGVTVQRIALEMDAGDILIQEVVALSGSETTGTLSEVCSELGAKLLVEALHRKLSGTETFHEQNHIDATYCPLIGKQAGKIDWTFSAIKIDRMVRAYTPSPGAYTSLRDKRLSILSAHEFDPLREPDAFGQPESEPGTVVDIDKGHGILVKTGAGTLAVDNLQLQSKKPNHFRDFLNGQPGGSKAFTGTKLGGEV